MEKINVREKPGRFGKFFRRIPSYLYRLGVTKPFETNTLNLSTKGRKSGRTVRTSLGFAKKDNIIYIAALYPDSDWYQNTLKNQEVEIQIGKERMKAHASKVDDSEEKAEAYKAIVSTQRENMGENYVEKYYYVKPGMDDREIGSTGESLPIMRFELKNIR